MKKILLTTAIIGLMAVPGFADSHDNDNGDDDMVTENGDATDTDAEVEAEADAEAEAGAAVDVADLSADDLMGADVMSSDDERVGDVDDVLLDGEGTIESILFDVGGFLGIGAQTVEVGVEDFEILEVDDELQVQLDLSEEQIEELPEYEE